MPILEQEESLSCKGCVHLDTSLFGDWYYGDCSEQGTNWIGMPIIERVYNARALWGHCGPERKNWKPKPTK